MSYIKSMWAVIAGFIVVVALSTGTDALLQTIGLYPMEGMLSTGLLALALAYRTVFTVLGGFATAWLAPRNPMNHVWALAIIGQLGGIAGVYAGWDLSAHWYPIAIAVLAIPSVWLGGYLKARNADD